MAETNGNSRLDRIERILETQNQQIAVHTQQIAMHTQQIAMLLEHGHEVNQFLYRTAEAQLKLAEAHNRLELAQAETTEKLNALIAVVDSLVKRGGPGAEMR